MAPDSHGYQDQRVTADRDMSQDHEHDGDVRQDAQIRRWGGDEYGPLAQPFSPWVRPGRMKRQKQGRKQEQRVVDIGMMAQKQAASQDDGASNRKRLRAANKPDCRDDDQPQR